MECEGYDVKSASPPPNFYIALPPGAQGAVHGSFFPFASQQLAQ